MQIVRDECCLYTTKQGVEHDTNWQEETGSNCINPRERRQDGRTTGKQHGSNENVGHQAENDENNMNNGSVSSTESFEEGMRIWSPPLELDGQCSEQDDLDRSTCITESE